MSIIKRVMLDIGDTPVIDATDKGILYTSSGNVSQDADLTWEASTNTLNATNVSATTTTLSGLTSGSIVFAGTNGLLSQDNAQFSYTSSTGRVKFGSGSGTIARLTLWGDTTTDEIMYWLSTSSNGQKAVLMSCNGFSVTESRLSPTEFHFANLSGRVYATVQEAVNHTSDPMLRIEGAATGRTVPTFIVRQCPTPGASAYMQVWRSYDGVTETDVSYIDKDGNFVTPQATITTIKSGSNTLAGTVANKLNPVHLAHASQVIGDLLYADSTTTMTRLAAVATGQVLASAGTGTAPGYTATPTVTSITLSSLTSGRIPIVSTNGLLADSANFLWATAGGADKITMNGATALGAINIKASNLGYYLLVNDTTHYSNTFINAALDYQIQTNSITVTNRFVAKQGSDTASANNLSLTGGATTGNYYVITDNTTINLISSTGWQDGALVTLRFTGTPTVKHNQTTSGSNVKILLTGNADLSATATTNLTLRLCTVGGVQAWRQECPVVTVA